jgi:hypothetical protein
MAFEPGKIPEGATPFKEGESGNPKGRPPGPSFSTLAKKFLKDEMNDDEKGKLTRAEFNLLKLMRIIENGSDKDVLKAIEMLYDRLEGKAVQTIQASLQPSQKELNDLFPFEDEETPDKSEPNVSKE